MKFETGTNSDDGLRHATADKTGPGAYRVPRDTQWAETERRLAVEVSEAGLRGLGVDLDYVRRAERKLAGIAADSSCSLSEGILDLLTRPCPLHNTVGSNAAAESPDADPDVWGRDTLWHGHDQKTTSIGDTRSQRASRLLRKISEIRELVNADGRLPYEVVCGGANTGRLTPGRGFNVLCMEREPVEGVDLRRCFIAPKGKVFGKRDYRNFEYRVLLYAAGDSNMLALLRSKPHQDIYETLARSAMGYNSSEPLGEFCNRTGSPLRDTAKLWALSLANGCGAGRLLVEARRKLGLQLSEQDALLLVEAFRRANPLIVGLWHRLEQECAACVGRDYVVVLPVTKYDPKAGRFLVYRDVQQTGDGLVCTIRGQERSVYGSLLAQNLVQATSRDIFVNAWLRCVDAGYRPVLCVHDELVFELEETSAEADLEAIGAIMEQPPPWAAELPLSTAGTLSRSLSTKEIF